MPGAEDEKVKPSPLGRFMNRVSRGIRSKSPSKPPAPERERKNSNGEVPSKFGSLVNRMSFRKHNKISKEQNGSVSRDNLADICVTQSPRAAVSETDLRFVTIRRGSDLPQTPLAATNCFYSEENLATPAPEPARRIPSYVNISCSLNGYRSPRPMVDNTPIRPKPAGKSLLQLRLQQLANPQTPVSNVSSTASSTSVVDSPMGAAVSSPSVKNLIGQFDRLHLCSDLDNSEVKENIEPTAAVVVEQPVQPIAPCPVDHQVKASTSGIGAASEEKKETKTASADSAPPTARSGQEFSEILHSTRRSLEERSSAATADLDRLKDMPEAAADSIRMACGKTHLLVRKKLGKFEELVNANLNPEQASKLTTAEDLEGYWGLVDLELTDINKCFAEVDMWRARNFEDAPAGEDTPDGETNTSLNNNEEKTTPKRAPVRPKAAKPISDQQKARDEERKNRLAEAKAKAKQQRLAQEAKPEGLMVL